jgi:4-alpha-glucanotransferase
VTPSLRRRHAGVIAPVFSLRSAADWGVGEIPDVAPFCAWLAAAGQGSLHVLPLLERVPGERSPYGGLSAFAIDPVYVGIDALEDFVAAGGRRALAPEDRDAIARRRADPVIAYDAVRALKRRALALAFAEFERAAGRARREAFEAFAHDEAAWLDDYVLYRAAREEESDLPWPSWTDVGLRGRDPAALAAARARLARPIRFHAWVQWMAHAQWRRTRAAAHETGVAIVGDVPFTVAEDSADVWAHAEEFDVSVAMGAPPDAFNADGQDWALPAFRWDVVRGGGYRWLGDRLRYAARQWDGARLDHVVGYFRGWIRPRDGSPAGFVPADEDEQRALGEAALAAIERAADVVVIAEDLGCVPDFVREAITAHGMPGYRVFRWETDGPVFRDPRRFPACSIATTGTHDTSTLAAWWDDELDDEMRRQIAALPGFEALASAGPDFGRDTHAALVNGLYGAGSDTALLLVQDLYAGRERINTPATVGDHNWGYRLPWPVETLAGAAERGRAAWLREIARRHGRSD